MPEFSAADHAMMARALRLADRGKYTAHPNPMVGCVIVKDDIVVGEGWHELAGEAHAEINALRAAGDRARGADVYVSLEPCAHHGKTPPCAPALVEAGVASVTVALEDPFAEVDGRGLQALVDAGIEVRKGLLRGAAARQIAGFISRTTRGRPYVRLKLAASIDGCIAMASGESEWITGPAARADVQRLRARSGAILTGIGTILADDPSLTVRDDAIDMRGRQPLRVVVDSGLRMPLSTRMLALPGSTLVYCSDDRRRQSLEKAGAEIARIGGDAGRVDLAALLGDLGRREINDVLVEAGPALAGSLMQQRLVDELVIYQAPHILGSETMGMFKTPLWTELADRQLLAITDTRRIGQDLRITAVRTEGD